MLKLKEKRQLWREQAPKKKTEESVEETVYDELLSLLGPRKKRRLIPDHSVPLSDHDQPVVDQGGWSGAEGDSPEREVSDTETRTEGIKDHFKHHFDLALTPEEVSSLQFSSPGPPSLCPPLGLVCSRAGLPGTELPLPPLPCLSLSQCHVKSKLCQNSANSGSLSDLQRHLLPIICSYKDMLFSQRSEENSVDLRTLYVLHALNHIIKTRSQVLKNNKKLLQAASECCHIEELRDQGLTRPKVLILVPFRHSALQVVETLVTLLLPTDQGVVHNQRRFRREFGAEPESSRRVVPKPSSYTATFSGNTDDCFRLGVAVRGKVVRLFADFYSADIIVASPLGLRTVIGAEGESKRDFDFLSSVEILVLDQTDIFLMQNWEHVTHVLGHLHRRPGESHGVDFSRVRLWSLNEWSHLYRQTIVISSLVTPEINSLFSSHCSNYAGAVRCDVEREEGSVGQVAKQLPQMFVRLPSSLSPSELPDHRLEHFTTQVLPGYHGDLMKGTLIFIPSYFDFVRVRNSMKKQELSFASICEYTAVSGVTRARTQFYQGLTHFLLYTERAHFFQRYKLRGVHHLLLYSLPTYPEHYSELVNMVEGEGGTVEVLYTHWEQLPLSRVVGRARAQRMLDNSDSTHMIVTGKQPI